MGAGRAGDHAARLGRVRGADHSEPLLRGASCGQAPCCFQAPDPRSVRPRAARALRVVDPLASRPLEPVAQVGGFNVHAKLAIDGHDRKRLERICRYLGRPPIAQERLERLSDGRLRFTMKKPWRDGTTALLFEPLDLIARLCAMVPPPWFHMIRFHGLLAPHAKLRAEVVRSLRSRFRGPTCASRPSPGHPRPPSDAVPAMPATGYQLELDLLGPTASRPPTRKAPPRVRPVTFGQLDLALPTPT